MVSPSPGETDKSAAHDKPSIAVIGAGISGLMCARVLRDEGLSVVVFDKGRGPGGRMATRRAGESLRFDHGAQYFTVRDPSFGEFVNSWHDGGVVQQLTNRIVVLEGGRVLEEKGDTERFVGCPGMNAVCRQLALGLDVRLRTQAAPLRRTADVWRLHDVAGENLGHFDIVVVSAPAQQTADLLIEAPALATRARSVSTTPCWAVMLAFTDPLQLDFGAAFVQNSPLGWICRNSDKPSRPAEPETWVLHATPEWSSKHCEHHSEDVLRMLLEAFWDCVAASPRRFQFAAAHRWRYALPTTALQERCLFDAQRRVVACGDWCGGPRVEGAFLSGVAAANQVIRLR